MPCPPCVHSVEFLVVPSNEGNWTRESWRGARAEGPDPWRGTRGPSARHLLTKTNQQTSHPDGEPSPSLSTFSDVLQDTLTDIALTHFGRKETSCHMTHRTSRAVPCSILAAERRTDPLSNSPPPPPLAPSL